MGLDLLHVLSPERHFCEFACSQCRRLTSLDSYVTSTCSHPICRSCCQKGLPDECPLCNQEVGVMNKLGESQPLAHRVLSRVKVACPLRNRCGCNWAGEYGDIQAHMESHRPRGSFRNSQQKKKKEHNAPSGKIEQRDRRRSFKDVDYSRHRRRSEAPSTSPVMTTQQQYVEKLPSRKLPDTILKSLNDTSERSNRSLSLRGPIPKSDTDESNDERQSRYSRQRTRDNNKTTLMNDSSEESCLSLSTSRNSKRLLIPPKTDTDEDNDERQVRNPKKQPKSETVTRGAPRRGPSFEEGDGEDPAHHSSRATLSIPRRGPSFVEGNDEGSIHRSSRQPQQENNEGQIKNSLKQSKSETSTRNSPRRRSSFEEGNIDSSMHHSSRQPKRDNKLKLYQQKNCNELDPSHKRQMIAGVKRRSSMPQPPAPGKTMPLRRNSSPVGQKLPIFHDASDNPKDDGVVEKTARINPANIKESDTIDAEPPLHKPADVKPSQDELIQEKKIGLEENPVQTIEEKPAQNKAFKEKSIQEEQSMDVGESMRTATALISKAKVSSAVAEFHSLPLEPKNEEDAKEDQGNNCSALALSNTSSSIVPVEDDQTSMATGIITEESSLAPYKRKGKPCLTRRFSEGDMGSVSSVSHDASTNISSLCTDANTNISSICAIGNSGSNNNNRGSVGSTTDSSSDGPVSCSPLPCSRARRSWQQDQPSVSTDLEDLKGVPGVDVAITWKEKGDRAMMAGDWKGAAELFTGAIESIPNYNRAPTLVSSLLASRAFSFLRLNLHSRCIDDSDDSVGLNDHNVEAYIWKSAAQLELQRVDDACRTLNSGIDRNPKSTELIQKLKHIKGFAKVNKEIRMLRSSHRHVDILNITNDLDFSDKRIHIARAAAHLALSKYDDAIEDANKVLLSDSRNLSGLMTRAKARFLNGQLDEALIDCTAALEVDQQHIGLVDLCNLARRVHKLYNIAEEAMQQKTYKQASSLYGMAINAAESLPKESELYRILYLGRAEANLKAGNHMQALANINLVIEARPSQVGDEEGQMSALKVTDNMAIELEEVVRRLKSRKGCS